MKTIGNHRFDSVLLFFSLVLFVSCKTISSEKNGIYELQFIDNEKSHEDQNIITDIKNLLQSISLNGKGNIYSVRLYQYSGIKHIMICQTIVSTTKDIVSIHHGVIKYPGKHNTQTYFFVDQAIDKNISGDIAPHFFRQTSKFISYESLLRDEKKYKEWQKKKYEQNDDFFRAVDGDDLYVGYWRDGKLITLKSYGITTD